MDQSWCLDDQSFEKMGALMAENHCKLLGLYDKLAMFLSQINVFRGRGLSDTHELALFLQLYSANAWTRRTGRYVHFVQYDLCSYTHIYLHTHTHQSMYLYSCETPKINPSHFTEVVWLALLISLVLFHNLIYSVR